ncbi:hypothetical protein BGZ81_010855 [Podila clonocystis]|nr:hypothetical protein BGZ81_010855 [Podila clonocystis]
MEENIFQMLESVQWPTIKSLVISGDHIDDWVQLWALDGTQIFAREGTSMYRGPRLLQLSIIGTPTTHQELSHTSALFIHQLVHSSLLVELHIESIGWEEDRDRDIIVEAITSLHVPPNLPPYINVGSAEILQSEPLEHAESDQCLETASRDSLKLLKWTAFRWFWRD